jgi:hypothetical protein
LALQICLGLVHSTWSELLPIPVSISHHLLAAKQNELFASNLVVAAQALVDVREPTCEPLCAPGGSTVFWHRDCCDGVCLEEDGDDVERVAVFVIGVRVGAEAKEDAAQYVREEDDI